MKLFTETPEFEQWLQELSAMPSTSQSENLYGNDDIGRQRLANLRSYFQLMAELSPEVVLIGEAPGYQGTRRTGVPFGSEHIIMGEMDGVEFFHKPSPFRRVFNDRLHKEPTSTIMWRTISQLNTLPLLWAAYPLHPHETGNTESNRTPTRSEVASTKAHLLKFLAITNAKTVLSLGNTAKRTLDELGVLSQKIRHPARGGGGIFAQQLTKIIV